MTRNDNVDSEVPLKEEVENNQSCQQPDTELPTAYSETSVSECQNCADYKTKLGRLKETYRIRPLLTRLNHVPESCVVN